MARTQQRGPITDYFGRGPFLAELRGEGPLVGDRRLALCVCKHGVEWPEGGEGCVPCMREWAAHPAHPSNAHRN